VVSRDPDGLVTGITDVHGTDVWVNGGYFMFRQEIFDYIREGEDLVEEPFQRLLADDQLLAYRYEGFWTAMDTFKDLQNLQALHDGGAPPWAPWQVAHRSPSDASQQSSLPPPARLFAP
jgi:glucose-1-phosphate cytidylyltransferase